MAATSTNAPRTETARREGRITPLARAFASTSALSREEMIAAPVSWPRPSRLAEPLNVKARRMAAGLRALGLLTVGDLLEHLPSDSREARTVSGLRAGEPATVAVQVRRIAARPVRRRGMRPLVEANVFDSSGTMRATFFNQPWLVRALPAGHPSAAARQARRSRRIRASPTTRSPPSAARRPGRRASRWPTTRPRRASARPRSSTSSARRGGSLRDIPEALPSATRVGESLPDRPSALAAMHFPRSAEDLESGRRRLAFEELLLTQLLFLRRRATPRAAHRRRTCSTASGTLTERWRSEILPFTLTGDQRGAMEAIRARPGRPDADAHGC